MICLEIVTLGFFSVVGAGIGGSAGDGVEGAPGAAAGVIDGAFGFFGQFIVGDESFHVRHSFGVFKDSIGPKAHFVIKRLVEQK